MYKSLQIWIIKLFKFAHKKNPLIQIWIKLTLKKYKNLK